MTLDSCKFPLEYIQVLSAFFRLRFHLLPYLKHNLTRFPASWWFNLLRIVPLLSRQGFLAVNSCLLDDKPTTWLRMELQDREANGRGRKKDTKPEGKIIKGDEVRWYDPEVWEKKERKWPAKTDNELYAYHSM